MVIKRKKNAEKKKRKKKRIVTVKAFILVGDVACFFPFDNTLSLSFCFYSYHTMFAIPIDSDGFFSFFPLPSEMKLLEQEIFSSFDLRELQIKFYLHFD